MKKYYIIVSGLVQGVFFRHNAKKKADELGIKGFVRNLGTGKVEIVAEGENDDLNNFLKWCAQGPSGAHVKEVNAKDIQIADEFKRFEIIY